MNKQLFTEFALMQIPTIICFVWWAANEKSKIYQAIDGVKDILDGKFGQMDKRLDLHIQDSHHARENLFEKINGQGRRFGSKFNRIERYIEVLVGRKIQGENFDEQ